MKTNKNLSNSFSSKVWNKLINIDTKLTSLEELIMNNATVSEIYENARNRIVNSALGKALGLTNDTQILDAAIEIESISNNGAITKQLTMSEEIYNIPKGFHNGNGKVIAPSFINPPSEILAYKWGIACNSTSSPTYTATEDCFVVISGYTNGNSPSTGIILSAKINDTYIFNTQKTTDKWQK